MAVFDSFFDDIAASMLHGVIIADADNPGRVSFAYMDNGVIFEACGSLWCDVEKEGDGYEMPVQYSVIKCACELETVSARMYDEDTGEESEMPEELERELHDRLERRLLLYLRCGE